MVNGAMSRELLANTDIGPVAIGHQVAISINVLVNQWAHGGRFLIFYRNGPNRTAALGGDQNSLFGCSLAAFVQHTGLGDRVASDIHFVQFDDAG